mgnify:CR=1 FL=1
MGARGKLDDINESPWNILRSQILPTKVARNPNFGLIITQVKERDAHGNGGKRREGMYAKGKTKRYLII